MAGRLAQLRAETDPILTKFAVGYRPVQGIARLVAPVIKADRESGTFFKFGKEGFYIYDTERALRANAKKADYHLTNDTFLCTEHAIETSLDYKELDQAAKYGASRVLQLEKRSINFTQRILEVELEKAVADIVFSTTYYATGNKTTLTGGNQWNEYATSDPVGDVATGRIAARADMGIEPNTMVIGYTAWEKLRFHPALLENLKYSQKGIVTEDLAAQLLGVDRIIVGKKVYSTDAGVFTDLWNDSVALIYVPTDNNGNVMGEEAVEGTTPHTVIIEEMGYPEVRTYDEKKVRSYETTRKYQVKNVSTSYGYLILDTVA